MLVTEAEKKIVARCEELGVAGVREMIASGKWTNINRRFAEAWLARKETETADQESQDNKRIARSAKNAAWIAAIAAIVAAAAAIWSAFIAFSGQPPS